MYKRVEPQEGEPLQYVGVYITRWQLEWGTPSVGFKEAEYRLPQAVNDLNKIQGLEGDAYSKVLAILKNLDPYTS